MVARGFFVFFLILVGAHQPAKCYNPEPNPSNSKILNRVISIDATDLKLELVLRQIEQKAYFKFSYNSSLIESEKPVTIKMEKAKVLDILNTLFGNRMRYKEAGNHLILLQNDEEGSKLEKPTSGYYFSGKIIDSETGEPISGASIYEIEARQASISDSYGNYHLTLSSEESMHGFYFSKKGYYDTTLVVNAQVSLVNNIVLTPVDNSMEKLPGTQVESISVPIEERPLSKQIIPEDNYIHSENLKAIQETRWAQISFLPSFGIGSDLSTNGLMVNRISLNILAGYSNGVAGCEIGGIANMTKNNVTGVQIGGVGNLVGGEIHGVQIGGISNIVLNNVSGTQISGVSNLVNGHVNGVQIGGISNMITGGFSGIQIGGINNFARTTSHGFQIAGINNIVADTLVGGQIAGIGNWARRGVNSCQISGIINLAYVNDGLQLTGIYNHCKENQGFQLGIINTSESGDGAALGLFTYCRDGYRAFEFSANDVFPINLTFKSGFSKLYTSYHAGALLADNSKYAFGIGIGNKTTLSKRISLSTDINTYIVQFYNFETFQGNELHRVSLTLDIRIGKILTFYFGPNFNVGVARYKDAEGSFVGFTSYDPLHTVTYTNSQVQIWCGAQAGLRFGKERGKTQ